jgi:Uma2 family endonuclease
MTQPAYQYYSFEEYLTLEEAAPEKNEYYKGEIFVMSGGSDDHNGIAMNIGTYLNLALIDKPCRVFGSDMKIRIDAADYSTYPDVVVVCGAMQYWNNRRDIIVNPLLIVEVLSPSTQNFDKFEKFEFYRNLSSFAHYLIVAQDRFYVEYHRKTGEGWLTRYYNQAEQVIELKLPDGDVNLALSQIYQKTDIMQS